MQQGHGRAGRRYSAPSNLEEMGEKNPGRSSEVAQLTGTWEGTRPARRPERCGGTLACSAGGGGAGRGEMAEKN